MANSELSFGAQLGVEGRFLGLANASFYGDSGTFRSTVGTDAFHRGGGAFSFYDITVTQGGSIGAGLGPGEGAGIFLQPQFERRGGVGVDVPSGQKLANQDFSFSYAPDPFVGIDISAAFMFGVAFEFAVNLPVDGSCSN